jgi:hypothetical protein
MRKEGRMPKLTIKCEVDGKEIALYEFDVTGVSPPQKLLAGPITIYFDPVGDVHHRLDIDSLPSSKSKTIKGSNPSRTST